MSQPILIMVLTQSVGKYCIHCKMFCSERAMSAAFTADSIGAAGGGISNDSSAKACCCTWVSVRIDLLPVLGRLVVIVAQAFRPLCTVPRLGGPVAAQEVIRRSRIRIKNSGTPTRAVNAPNEMRRDQPTSSR